jgi:glycosyltransferase involved in cell wall biosynthesis
MSTASTDATPSSISLSVVVPVKDEESNVVPLLEEIREVLAPAGIAYETVFVDDGSTDETLKRLIEAKAQFPELRVIQFERNCGQTAAMDAGMRAARGEFLALLDGDRQNDPRDIPRMLEKANEGFDMVAGWREKRNDTLVRKLSSLIANAVRNRILHDGIRDTGCTLKVFRRACIDPIKLYTGMHRFLPALFQIQGYRVTQMPVNHRPRTAGRTKYGIGNRLWRSMYDLIAVRWMQRRTYQYRIKKEW